MQNNENNYEVAGREEWKKNKSIIFNSKKNLVKNLTIDKTNSKFDLKIKGALHINWRKPSLNAKQNHLTLTLSL